MDFCAVRLDVDKLGGKLDLHLSYVSKAGLLQFRPQRDEARIACQLNRNCLGEIGSVRFPAADHGRGFGNETQPATRSQDTAALAEGLRTANDVVNDIDGKYKVKLISGQVH